MKRKYGYYIKREDIDVCNQANPFHHTVTSLLVEIAKGGLDCRDLAAQELAARYRDQSGRYVGQKKSAQSLAEFRKGRQ